MMIQFILGVLYMYDKQLMINIEDKGNFQYVNRHFIQFNLSRLKK